MGDLLIKWIIKYELLILLYTYEKYCMKMTYEFNFAAPPLNPHAYISQTGQHRRFYKRFVVKTLLVPRLAIDQNMRIIMVY